MDYVKFTNLDKCPRCGSWAKIKFNMKTKKYFIECNQCHAKTNEHSDLNICAAWWSCDETIFLPVECCL